jgi:cytochrome oxidase Cu insertion factor (SCO1/SenC/PrrC family)
MTERPSLGPSASTVSRIFENGSMRSARIGLTSGLLNLRCITSYSSSLFRRNPPFHFAKKISGSIIAKKIRREDVNVAEPKPTPAISAEGGARLKEGGEMPPFSLTNQNGERISLNTFRSKPFVLTFVFTRCPVPNFCPRMANNFEELQMAIKTGSGALAKTLLLSITLDLGFDTPQVLSAYAASHQTDPKVWTFATDHEQEIDALTRAFSVYRQTEGGTISQGSLRR